MARASLTSSPARFASPVPRRRTADEAGLGARLMGVTLTVPQREITDLLNAQTLARGALYRDPVIQVPRRSGKTSSIFAEMVGRCVSREDYQVTYCAQSGIKSRERYLGLRKMLDRHARDLSGWKPRESRGEERLEFANGSVLRFLPPKQESFRGDAGDAVVLDEAQEIDPEDGADLVGAVLPLFDTRPGGGQLIIAGTAGKARSGLYWHALEEARRGRRGVLDYSADDDADPTSEATWRYAHPGIGTLTTVEMIRERFEKMGAEQFAREYLGMWPLDAVSVGLSPATWAVAGVEQGPLPTRFSLAFDVAPDRSSAAVGAAWKDEEGLTRVEVLDAEPGTAWLVPVLLDLARRHRTPILYDTAGGALDLADELSRARPRPETRGLSTAQYAGACAGFVARVVDGRLRHHRQVDLDRAVEGASRRSIGDGLWGWGRRASAGSIAPLVAVTVAVAGLEAVPRARTRRPLSAHDPSLRVPA